MKKLSICLFVFLFFSCATGYQPSGFKGGFEETQLDDNVFKITFKGNTYTSKEKANDFNLLRCSEVTLQNNFKYFIIKETYDFSKETTQYVMQKNNNYNSYNKNATYTANEKTRTRPRIANTIECYKEKPKSENTVYNAEMIQKNLKKKYNIQ